MKKVIIFGTNNYTDIFYHYLMNDERYEVVAYTVNEKYIESEIRNGIPVVPFETIEKEYSVDEHEILVSVGYTQMNERRKNVFFDVKKKGYNVFTYIHPRAIVLSDQIGEGCLIMAGANIEYGCKIGISNIINPNVLISHNAEIGDFNFFAGSSSMAGNCVVENHCMIGMNSTIRHELKIASYSLIGAGAYVNFNTEEDGVYVPARTIKLEKKSRDITI